MHYSMERSIKFEPHIIIIIKKYKYQNLTLDSHAILMVAIEKNQFFKNILSSDF